VVWSDADVVPPGAQGAPGCPRARAAAAPLGRCAKAARERECFRPAMRGPWRPHWSPVEKAFVSPAARNNARPYLSGFSRGRSLGYRPHPRSHLSKREMLAPISGREQQAGPEWRAPRRRPRPGRGAQHTRSAVLARHPSAARDGRTQGRLKLRIALTMCGAPMRRAGFDGEVLQLPRSSNWRPSGLRLKSKAG